MTTGVLARLRAVGWATDAVGLLEAGGALIGAHRGALFDPLRETPSHSWAASYAAIFEDVGQWKRALAFPQQDEDVHAAVRRECKAVRETGGIFDASTLGKIEVVGRDALRSLRADDSGLTVLDGDTVRRYTWQR